MPQTIALCLLDNTTPVRMSILSCKRFLPTVSSDCCAESPMVPGMHYHAQVTACWRALSEHEHFCQLTTPEKLQMINQRPLQPVAVHLVSLESLGDVLNVLNALNVLNVWIAAWSLRDIS